MRRLALFLLLTFCLGCTKKPIVVHPGAISNLDSYAYDVLLVEQDTLNQAREGVLSGALPASLKAQLNMAIAQYNVTQQAWQTYHASHKDETPLQQALQSLVAAVGELMKQMPNKNVLQPANTTEVWNVNPCYA